MFDSAHCLAPLLMMKLANQIDRLLGRRQGDAFLTNMRASQTAISKISV